MGEESVLDPSDAGSHIANGEDALKLVALITQTCSSGAVSEAHDAHAKNVVSSVALDKVTPLSSSSGSHGPITGDPVLLQKSYSVPSPAIREVMHAVESSEGNPIALVSDLANVTAIGTTEDIKDEAESLALTRLRGVVFIYAAKLPIVGSYFVESSVDAPTSETIPLLGALRDPKAFATEQAGGLLCRLFSQLSSRIPDVDALDNVDADNYGPIFKTFAECYALARDGGGRLITNLQEHSLIIAPTVSLGHLSTIDLAASTIGTTVTSVTGYSIIRGFISSLDKVLANAPDRRTAKMACAQVAIVTGVVLFPIINLWTVHSATLLQQLGQPPEVARPASEFLQITAAALPAYAIGEIAKRYLSSLGETPWLSHMYTRILSVTAPLNLLLNHLLVNGPIPAIRMGFAGAPLCTVISHNALAAMLIVFIVLREGREEVDYLRGRNTIPDEPLDVHDASSPPTRGKMSQNHSEVTFFASLRTLVLAGVSGVLKSVSQLWSKDLGGFVASILGPDALATQAVLLTTATTLHQVPKAMGNASSDRIKKWVAKGVVQRAKIAAVVALFGTLGCAFVISGVLFASATSWGRLFNSDPIIIEKVSALLPIIAIFQVVHAIGEWVDNSLGALGKTAVFPSLNASTDYFLGVPLGVYLALLRGWGLAGLWVGLSVGLAYACLAATMVLVRINWKNAVSEESGNKNARPDEEGVVSATESRSIGVSV